MGSVGGIRWQALSIKRDTKHSSSHQGAVDLAEPLSGSLHMQVASRSTGMARCSINDRSCTVDGWHSCRALRSAVLPRTRALQSFHPARQTDANRGCLASLVAAHLHEGPGNLRSVFGVIT